MKGTTKVVPFILGSDPGGRSTLRYFDARVGKSAAGQKASWAVLLKCCYKLGISILISPFIKGTQPGCVPFYFTRSASSGFSFTEGWLRSKTKSNNFKPVSNSRRAHSYGVIHLVRRRSHGLEGKTETAAEGEKPHVAATGRRCFCQPERHCKVGERPRPPRRRSNVISSQSLPPPLRYNSAINIREGAQ